MVVVVVVVEGVEVAAPSGASHHQRELESLYVAIPAFSGVAVLASDLLSHVASLDGGNAPYLKQQYLKLPAGDLTGHSNQ